MNSRDDFFGPINLGNPIEFSILDLAKKVIQLTGSNSKLLFKPLPEDDPKQRKPDIGLAEKELEWKPTIELNKGLERTINYFKEKFYIN